MEEGRGEWVRKNPAARKARAEKSAAAKDKVKAAARAAAKAAAAEAAVKAKAAAKAKAAKKPPAAAAGAAALERLRLDPYEGYWIKKQKMVKIDHRNSYIKWLLEWDKKPRRPLPNFPEELREAMDAIKAERDENERVLADFKRDRYAYVQVDVFNDDDPRANLPDDQYEVIPHDSDEEA